MKSHFCVVWSVIMLAATAPPLQSASARPPNILYILCDDLRWNTLGCMGDTIIQTPHLDHLAKEGTLFRNEFATTSICCVSRASILTGQYERRHGIPNFSKPLTPAQWAQCYPALLRRAGYRVGFIGKFGVGGEKDIAAMATNFDYWRGLPGQAGEYFIDPHDPSRTHATAKFGNQALEFLRDCRPGRPFCLSVSFNAPHSRDGKPREFQPDLRDESLYVTNIIPHSPTANEDYFERLPYFVQNSEARKRWQRRFATPPMFQNTMRDYYRLVTGIDREVGRMMAELQTLQQADNTIIIFTSDNGWFAGDRGLAGKWFMYEESIRLPLIIYDPRPARQRRGSEVTALTLNLDAAQTILDFAGVTAPPGMQGRSLVPLLSAAPPADWRADFFYEHHFGPAIIPPSEGVRSEHWSFIHWLQPNPETEELYDLQNDPLESQNLAGDPNYAGVLADLQFRWRNYCNQLK